MKLKDMKIWAKRGTYQISSDGRVFSTKSNKFLTPRVHSHGYLRVSISKKDYYIHRLVAEYFLGESDCEVNHKNGDKKDNRVENLEYVSSKENKQHAWNIGMYNHKGINHYRSYITEDIARAILEDKETNHAEVARKFGVNWKLVHNIRRGISWKHLHKRESY